MESMDTLDSMESMGSMDSMESVDSMRELGGTQSCRAPPTTNTIGDRHTTDNRTKHTNEAVVLLTCPTCNKQETCGNKAFLQKDLDASFKCNSCRTPSRVREWTCPCQLPWHACPLHQDSPRRFTTDMFGNTITNTSDVPSTMLHGYTTKRKACQEQALTHEQLIQYDLKRARKEQRKMSAKPTQNYATFTQHEVLMPKANLLSNKLKERFAYPLNIVGR